MHPDDIETTAAEVPMEIAPAVAEIPITLEAVYSELLQCKAMLLEILMAKTELEEAMVKFQSGGMMGVLKMLGGSRG